MKYTKAILFSWCVGISLLLSSALDAKNQSIKTYTPANSVIAWDFHGVLAQRQPWRMAKHLLSIIWSDQNIWQLIKIAPSAFYDAYDMYYSSKICSTYEEIIEALTDKYPAIKQHKSNLLNLITFYIPLEGSVTLLEQLKQTGYRNFLASNMGEFTYKAMKQKYPEIFINFEEIFLPQTHNEGSGFKIGKPCLQYFQTFRSLLESKEIDETITIIFIDDKQENVEAADTSNLNIHGILFTFPDELKRALNQILLVKPQSLKHRQRLSTKVESL